MEPIPSTTDVSYKRNGAFTQPASSQQVRDRYWLHLLLFALTLATTMQAGGALAGRLLRYEDLGWFWFVPDGLRFGCSLLLFLTVHEFGHYFAARYHRVKTSLPYYVPLPILGIGTLGAVIRIREPIPSLRKLFDIGVAGPMAGFVVALGVLLYALFTLAPPDYIMDLPGHELLKQYIGQYGHFPGERLAVPSSNGQNMTLVVGQTPLYWLLSQFFPNVPPMYEMYHYPILFAGWLGLFFTALNLLPVGQLDGGHILYALVGPKWHGYLARGFLLLLLFSGALGFVEDVVPMLPQLFLFISSTLGFVEDAVSIPQHYNVWAGRLSWFILAGILYFYLGRIFKGDYRLIAPILMGLMMLVALAQFVEPVTAQLGYNGWFIWCLLIVFLVQVDHPPVLYHEPLTPGRRLLGILNLIIFALCFSIKPLYVV